MKNYLRFVIFNKYVFLTGGMKVNFKENYDQNGSYAVPIAALVYL
jgi:hypothetical protein